MSNTAIGSGRWSIGKPEASSDKATGMDEAQCTGASSAQRVVSDELKANEKVIYLTVRGHELSLKISVKDSAETVTEVFRAAADAGQFDTLKLYDINDVLLSISPHLSPNTSNTRYRLDAFEAHYPDELIAKLRKVDLTDLRNRVSELESKLQENNGVLPPCVREVKVKVAELSEELENLKKLSWNGLASSISNNLFPFKRNDPPRKKECNEVFAKVRSSRCPFADSVRLDLRLQSFSNWPWDDAQMIQLIKLMFHELGFIQRFNISDDVLTEWLFRVYECYYNVPFHNFNHAFMVCQMMYALIWLTDLQSKLSPLEVFALLCAAICHDLEHPGYNNTFLVNMRTELAIRYNDMSPLENHHCSVAFAIVTQEGCNIFSNVSEADYKLLRSYIIQAILATDMARHDEILNDFRRIIPTFDWELVAHKNLLMMILMKTADISNEVRPLEVANVWAECLFTEYFNQSDTEKREKMNVTPYMDRDKVTKSASQIGFIKFRLLPLFEALGELFPNISAELTNPIHKSLKHYENLQTQETLAVSASLDSSCLTSDESRGSSVVREAGTPVQDSALSSDEVLSSTDKRTDEAAKMTVTAASGTTIKPCEPVKG